MIAGKSLHVRSTAGARRSGTMKRTLVPGSKSLKGRGRAMPIEDFYVDFAWASFGPGVAATAGRALARSTARTARADHLAGTVPAASSPTESPGRR